MTAPAAIQETPTGATMGMIDKIDQPKKNAHFFPPFLPLILLILLKDG
jgi:hypothetical protein